MTAEASIRVLKYGLVQDGKLVDEDTLGEKEGITIGKDPSNTISVAEANVPRKHRLIEPSGSGYKLTFFQGLDGKIVLGNEIHTLDEMIASGNAVAKGNQYEVMLDEFSKGKLAIGKTAILFQLVPPPPPPPIITLPKELRGSMFGKFDWAFMVVLIISAIFHFSLVSYLNTLEPIETLTDQQAVKFAKKLVTTEDILLIEEDLKEDEDLEKKKKPGGGGPKGGSGGPEKKGVEQRGLLALITKHGGAGSVADVLSEGIGDDLVSALDGVGGVDVARKGAGTLSKGIKAGGGDGSGGSVKVGDLGNYSSKGSVKSGTKVETKVKSKISSASGGISGKIDQSAVYSIIRRRVGGVKYCYDAQLKTNPGLSGKIRVQFVIGSSGGVASCSVVSNSMGNTLVQECVCRMIRRWSFPAPEEGTVTVGHTFIFSPGS